VNRRTMLADASPSSSLSLIWRLANLLGRILMRDLVESRWSTQDTTESLLLSLPGGDDNNISISSTWMCKSLMPSARLCERARKCG
jgi:hypothetical protein